ncbi:MAG: alpha/beta fold hydrolase [Pyrinomonadaceae bacterium]|nr:alpha/beta fold hydrolase [Sphingobacteriaceae bacterium]
MKPSNNVLLIFLLLLNLTCKGQNDGTVRSSDSTQIYFRSFGSGKPLLIINGGPGMNSNGFENLAIKLSATSKSIIYDQRGTGKSNLTTLNSSTITMDLMIADIESLRKYLKIEKWSILGHSFGGMVASYYATKYPEHIESIILSSSGGIDLELLEYVGERINSKLSKQESDSLSYWNGKINKGDTSYPTRLGRGRALAPAYLYNKKNIPFLAERLTQGNAKLNQLMWDDLHKIKFDCSEKLKTFNKPVLIIQGKQDIIKPETAEKAHRILKNSKIVYMENCGHYGWLDNETAYFREVNSFLAPGN